MKIAGLDLSMNGSGLYKIEVDNKFNVINQEYMAFTQVKKNSNSHVIHFKKKDFKDNTHQAIWMQDKILEFVKDCDFIAIEDYAFSATGQVFNIAEFIGGTKQLIIRKHPNIKIRLHEPTVNKLFAVGRGNADKISICDEYDKLVNSKYIDKPISLNDLGQYKNPREDISDAYFLCKLMLLEVKLRNGVVQVKNCTEKQIQIFNRVTKAYPINLLARPFLCEEDY